jgi:hypothetical protein
VTDRESGQPALILQQHGVAETLVGDREHF